MKKNVIQSTALEREQDSEDLPKEWDTLNKRVTQIEKHLIILQNKSLKLEKKFSLHVQQITELQVELAGQMRQMKEQKLDQDIIHNIVKESFESLEQIRNKEFEETIEKAVIKLNPCVEDFTILIDQKLNISFDKNKLYIDRAVYELKQLLKKYVQDQAQIQKKINTSSRQKSTHIKHLGSSSSAKKIFQTESIKKSQIMSQANSMKDSAIGSSRVNYLREKLREFEKINKKYETPNEKGSQQMVEKMKSYKYFLQQSESELQPSNIIGDEQGVKNWKIKQF